MLPRGESDGHYRAVISLRISTPSLDPDRITSDLDIRPDGVGRGGHRHRTPKGTLTQRVHENNFWHARLSEIVCPPESLATELGRLLDQLTQARALLDAVRTDGGTAEFFVGYFMLRGNTGDVFDTALLGRLAGFGIRLGFDIYASSDIDADER